MYELSAEVALLPGAAILTDAAGRCQKQLAIVGRFRVIWRPDLQRNFPAARDGKRSSNTIAATARCPLGSLTSLGTN